MLLPRLLLKLNTPESLFVLQEIYSLEELLLCDSLPLRRALP
jgi:hypothetical protein